MFQCREEFITEVIEVLNILFPQSEFVRSNKLNSLDVTTIIEKTQYSAIITDQIIIPTKSKLSPYLKFQYHIKDHILMMDNCDYNSFPEFLLKTPIKELKTIKYLIERGE